MKIQLLVHIEHPNSGICWSYEKLICSPTYPFSFVCPRRTKMSKNLNFGVPKCNFLGIQTTFMRYRGTDDFQFSLRAQMRTLKYNFFLSIHISVPTLIIIYRT